ncbi:MAG: DUF1315 family protein [Porticoccaceae bacterium]|jgi:uncharacterized protein YeaC (DUF1315 family)|nr:DUF1315 family protein [Porticoccaceae bacterium]MDG1308781.1 DUF1315 family protein [Porticoccaceae bacterium]
MDLKQLLDSITPEVYERLKRAIEIGKWPDGRSLAAGQKELCIQAVIAYDERKPPEERTGYVPPKVSACAPELPEVTPIKWKN